MTSSYFAYWSPIGYLVQTRLICKHNRQIWLVLSHRIFTFISYWELIQMAVTSYWFMVSGVAVLTLFSRDTSRSAVYNTRPQVEHDKVWKQASCVGSCSSSSDCILSYNSWIGAVLSCHCADYVTSDHTSKLTLQVLRYRRDCPYSHCPKYGLH